jgi:hypothetical protein
VSTHCPLHIVRFDPHVHELFVQLSPPPHALPHEPQSNGSLVKSTHAFVQFVRPPPQVVVHVPPLHTWLEVHLSPHPPQLSGSLCVSVQTPRQRVPLLKHAHAPLWHVVPPLHLSPHAPQFESSVCSSTHD